MRIVAIETSGRHGSVATLSGEADGTRLLQQSVLQGDQRTAQVLAPTLRDLLSAVGWTPQSIELVAVATGPGSFTGLRIGVTTAKTFAYAVGSQVIGVNTLAVLAAQAPAGPGALWTILNAQRQELFVAKFATADRGNTPIDCETTIVRQDDWLAQLQVGDRVIGPAVHQLASRLPKGVLVVAEEFCLPLAAAVGQVAWRAYQAGRRDDVWTLAPLYFRQSAAEEKHKARLS